MKVFLPLLLLAKPFYENKYKSFLAAAWSRKVL